MIKLSQEMKSGFKALVQHIVPLTRRIERLIELDEAKVIHDWLGYLILPHVQVQERDDSASGVQAVITSNKKRKKAHPVQVQERDPDDVREETEVIR